MRDLTASSEGYRSRLAWGEHSGLDLYRLRQSLEGYEEIGPEGPKRTPIHSHFEAGSIMSSTGHAPIAPFFQGSFFDVLGERIGATTCPTKSQIRTIARFSFLTPQKQLRHWSTHHHMCSDEEGGEGGHNSLASSPAPLIPKVTFRNIPSWRYLLALMHLSENDPPISNYPLSELKFQTHLAQDRESKFEPSTINNETRENGTLRNTKTLAKYSMSGTITGKVAAGATAAVTSAVENVARTATSLTAGGGFAPREVYESSTQITRSYYLGHHASALNKMRQTISNVGLIIECRDFRVPICSWNPLLERSLAASAAGERSRIIVYTKHDLGPPSGNFSKETSIEGYTNGRYQNGKDMVKTLKKYHKNSYTTKDVMFLGTSAGARSRNDAPNNDKHLLESIKRIAREADSLTGMRAMVVGMPNSGKSTLLNRLRAKGMGLPKAAQTGATPGVTRKIGTPVRIIAGESADDPSSAGLGEGVFIMDTPGVFIPYVSDPEDMLRLALVGCVKDGVIPSVTVADYLLYHLNLVDPKLYTRKFDLGKPTNDVHEFLRAVATRTGKLRKGSELNLENAADWVVQAWRRGDLGRFALERVTEETLAQAVEKAREPTVSISQARKREKEQRKVAQQMKWAGITAPPGGSVA
ncbi:P-loop containing nucleoside triphosphate hydrolase protein [Neurospora hispaniola]|uniref:P-loop containing nucleoside triphosphate hydrolase protein n=1 Tax=Neurospora hispaniola TaxID=588809 RepID=A0AAJ0MPI5_9PEZI|nr:P-loop containing nucleoside triphosphate hydrolase protein [Neurospora hispaniola]